MMAKKVLLIQQENQALAELAGMLKSFGYTLETYSNGALSRKIRVEQECPGVIILNTDNQPEPSAKTLAELHQHCPDIPVIVLTKHGTVHSAVNAIKKGAADYITWPVPDEALKTIIERYYVKQRIRSNETDIISHSAKTKSLITADPVLLKLLDLARKVASSEATILIHGESGVGKELLAYYIHRHSRRADKPYIALNCAALPENLAESELFGYEKGAFTGASGTKAGKFELANGGTILLDEISEMPLPLQAKLLRSLQEREIDRIGGSKPIPVDVRVIAVSNTDLKTKVNKGTFREDLFFRLNVIPLTIPPLRDRKNDIPLLAHHFTEVHSKLSPTGSLKFAPETIQLLMHKHWKGNVRELENIIQRAVMICDGPLILPEHLLLNDEPDYDNNGYAVHAGVSVREMEKKLIHATLHKVGNNRTMAAEMLGISIRTLRNKLNEYRLENEEL